MNDAELGQLVRDFQLMPHVYQLLTGVTQADRQEVIRKTATLLKQQISRCRQSLEELPGGSLSANQQSELYEHHKQRLLRKSELLMQYQNLPVFAARVATSLDATAAAGDGVAMDATSTAVPASHPPV